MAKTSCPHSYAQYDHSACDGKGCSGCDKSGKICSRCGQPPTRKALIEV